MSEFCNKQFIIWARVSSWSCFCWLYRASPSLATKNIIIDFGVDHLVMSMCRVISCVVARGCLLWPVHSLGITLLAFALLHFVFQGQSCLLFQVSLDFLLLRSSPVWWKGNLFFHVSSWMSLYFDHIYWFSLTNTPCMWQTPISSVFMNSVLLDSPHKWDYEVFVFLSLQYFF